MNNGVVLSDDFNPRSRKGSDILWLYHQPQPDYFNPRSRKGSDNRYNEDTEQIKNFNPRSRKGSDLTDCDISGLPQSISIHAPARGATFC